MTTVHPGRSATSSLRGVRPENEDAVVDVHLPDGRQLIAVADGMGGHRSGSVASSLALQALQGELRAGARLREAVLAANAEVYRAAERDPDCHGMGTTLVAVLRTGDTYEIANVGDSRAYRIDREGVRQLTVDHSFAAEAARSGLMSPEQIARSPWRNALTRSLGTQPEVQVDIVGPLAAREPPHVLLLCSDGLYRALSEGEMRDRLLSAPDADAAARLLCDLSLRNHSDDNVSAAVADFGCLLGAPPRASSPPAPRHFAALRSREARRPSAPRRLRRLGAAVMSDGGLFLLCTGTLLVWLTVRLLGG